MRLTTLVLLTILGNGCNTTIKDNCDLKNFKPVYVDIDYEGDDRNQYLRVVIYDSSYFNSTTINRLKNKLRADPSTEEFDFVFGGTSDENLMKFKKIIQKNFYSNLDSLINNNLGKGRFILFALTMADKNRNQIVYYCSKKEECLLAIDALKVALKDKYLQTLVDSVYSRRN